ncbi:NAD-dependent epimerase/dehydratase family protein [Yinghuangia soli]|uniref:NAD-dependent epimerase/dehydratase family protein n=1 Tax=Yinghuangia soli TaxID=2908204 RepID=A0AA41U2X0_9ACTN|nr:NAD-dependent epimerase/dehydratase family protein [Yinghuangia soli]MCF2529112.1 NAD-dependent epimerase/dehydratase family protein [Yinghuangia soli]
MRVLVTGVSGAIGSAVARSLLRRGHTVVGTVSAGSRSQAPDGVEVLPVDLFEAGALAEAARSADAAVHAASSNDERAGELDHIVVDDLIEAFEGTGKPLVYTSGLWLHGNAGAAPSTEESPFDPPMVVAWRPAVEDRLLAAASRGVRTVRIRAGLVYGGGRGYVPMLLAPQDGEGGKAVRHFGDGSNRWALVHADDLGDLYALAVEKAPAGSVYLGVAGEPVRVRDAAGVVAGRYGVQVQGWDPEDARQYWSVMVDAFLLDQAASSAKARAELGWAPSRPGLLEELAAA